MPLTEQQQMAVDRMQKFMASKDRSLILVGYAGSGKTYLVT